MRDIIASKTVNNVIRIMCGAFILATLLIGVLKYYAPPIQLTVLLMFVLLYVQLPGTLIVDSIKTKRMHVSTTIAMGLSVGWALCILQFFISSFLDSNIILYCVGPIMSLVYLFRCVKNNAAQGMTLPRFRLSRVSSAFCISLTLAVLYGLLWTQYLYLSPTVAEYTSINPDKAYHMGLINALSQGYPLQSPWVHGRQIHYHIFSEVLWSIPVRLFGVSSDVVTQSFAPYFTAFIVCVSFYSFFRELSAKPERAGIYSLVFVLSSIYITRNWYSSLGMKFIFVNDNSAGYAVSVALMFAVALNIWMKSYRAGEKGSFSYLVICVALIMLVTGIKGPIGAVLIAGMWGTIVLGVILRKITIKMFLPLLLMTAGFLLIYTTILGASGQINSQGGASIGFGGIANIAFWKDALASTLKAWGLPKIIRMPVMMFVFSAFFFTVYFVPFCLGYARELVLVLIGKKEYDIARIQIYAACLVGYLAMFVLHYRGHNQVYFGIATVALCPIVAYWFIEDMENASLRSKLCKRMLQTTMGIMAVSIILTSTSLIYSCNKAVQKIYIYNTHANTSNRYQSVSNEEYNAMKWLKENTEQDALLANDRYYSTAPEKYSYEDRWANRFFLYEVYSDRNSYLGGSGYDLYKADNPMRKERIENTNKLIDAGNENRGNLARELGIDYVIVSKRFSGERDLSNNDYVLCYSNKDVDIYKVAN